MTFSTINLTGERVLVKGTDRFGTDGETVLDATEWNEVQRHLGFSKAKESFDASVEEFFAPLMAAADQLQEQLSVPKPDPDSYIVLDEGEEGSAGRSREVIKLGHDSIVLRLIARGETDRLVWVMDQLEVMAVEDAPAQPVVDGTNAAE